MDTGLRSVASIWFQWVVPMPLADGPMMTWPTLSPRPSLLLSATVTRRDRSWTGSDMSVGDQGQCQRSPVAPRSQQDARHGPSESSPVTCLTPQPHLNASFLSELGQ